MEQIGIRDLKDRMSAVIKRVSAGETIEVTDHGHPVARLVPVRYRSRYEQMVAEGRITLAENHGEPRWLQPIEAQPGDRALTDILQEMRDGERY